MSTKPGNSKSEFYGKIYNTLLESARRQGVKNPEAVARLGAAQSALETGYGRSAPNNNYFGIKGKGGSFKTKEVINGKEVTITDSFRAYNSAAESADDYVKFLQKNKRYAGVLQQDSAEAAIQAQSRTGYATDPNYGNKLMSIHNSYGGGKGIVGELASTPVRSGSTPTQGGAAPAVGGFSDPTMNSMYQETDIPGVDNRPILRGISPGVAKFMSGDRQLEPLTSNAMRDPNFTQNIIQNSANNASASTNSLVNYKINTEGFAETAGTYAFHNQFQKEAKKLRYDNPAQDVFDKANEASVGAQAAINFTAANTGYRAPTQMPIEYTQSIERVRNENQAISVLLSQQGEDQSDGMITGIVNTIADSWKRGYSSIVYGTYDQNSNISHKTDVDFIKNIDKQVGAMLTSGDPGLANMSIEQVETLYNARNLEEMTYMANRIKAENDGDAYVAKQGMFVATLGGLIGGITDPVSLITGAGIEVGLVKAGMAGVKASEALFKTAKMTGKIDDINRAKASFNSVVGSKFGTVGKAVALNAAAGVVETGVSEAINPYNQVYTWGDYAMGAAVGGVLGGTIDFATSSYSSMKNTQRVDALANRMEELNSMIQDQKKIWTEEAVAAGHTSPEAITKFVGDKEEDMRTRGTRQILDAMNSKLKSPKLQQYAEAVVDDEMLNINNRKGRDNAIKALNSEKGVLRSALNGVQRSLDAVGQIPGLQTAIEGVDANIKAYDEQISLLTGEKDLAEAEQIQIREKITEIRNNNLIKADELRTVRKQFKSELREKTKDIDALIKSSESVKNQSWKSITADREFNAMWDDIVGDIDDTMIVKRDDIKHIVGDDISDFERMSLAHRYTIDNAGSTDPKIIAMRGKLDAIMKKRAIEPEALRNFFEGLSTDGTRAQRGSKLGSVDKSIKAGHARRKKIITKEQYAKLQEVEELEVNIQKLRTVEDALNIMSEKGATGAEIEVALQSITDRIRHETRGKLALVRQKEAIDRQIEARKGLDNGKLQEQSDSLASMIDNANTKIQAEKDTYNAFKNGKTERLHAYRESLVGKRVGVNNFDTVAIQDIIDESRLYGAGEVDQSTKDFSRGQLKGTTGDKMASNYAKGMGGNSVVVQRLMHLLGESPTGFGRTATGSMAKSILARNFLGNFSNMYDISANLYARKYGVNPLNLKAGKTANEKFNKQWRTLMEQRHQGIDVTNDPDWPVFAPSILEFEANRKLEAQAQEMAGIEGAEGLSENSIGMVSRVWNPKEIMGYLSNDQNRIAMRDMFIENFRQIDSFAGVSDMELIGYANKYVDLQHGKANGLNPTTYSANSMAGRVSILEAIQGAEGVDDAARQVLTEKFLNTPNHLKSRIEFDITKPMKDHRTGEMITAMDLMINDPKILNVKGAQQTAGMTILSQIGIKSPRDLDLHLKAAIEDGANEVELRAIKTVLGHYTGYRLEGASLPAEGVAKGIASGVRSVTLGGLPGTQLIELSTIAVNHGIGKMMMELPGMFSTWRKNVRIARNGYVSQTTAENINQLIGGYSNEGYMNSVDPTLMYYEGIENPHKHPVYSFLQGLESTQGVLSGYRALVGMQRGVSMNLGGQSLMKVIATGKIDRVLAEAGFTKEHADALRAEPNLFNDHGGIDLSYAKNYKMAGEVQMIMARIGDRDVLTTRDGEEYEILEGTFGMILGQFKRFTLAAKDKQLMRILRQRKGSGLAMALLTATPMVVGLVGLKVAMQSVGMSDEEAEKHFEKNMSAEALARATLMYSAHLGVFNDAFEVASTMSNAVYKKGQELAGVEDPQGLPLIENKHGGRGIAGIVPAASVANNVIQGIGNLDPKAAWNAMPYHNMLYMRWLSNLLFEKD